jgi:hypothetical protein
MSYFHEYKGVKRWTTVPETLGRLYSIHLTPEEVIDLTIQLCDLHGLSVPDLRFTGTSPHRGWYDHAGFIRLPRGGTQAIWLAHELAHHYVWTKLIGGREVPSHGRDFTRLYDRLALSLESLLIERDRITPLPSPSSATIPPHERRRP